MVPSPSDVIFPLATLFVLLGLGGGLLRRMPSLGDMSSDWLAVFMFGALAFAAVFAGALTDWNEGGEAALVGGAAAAALVMLSAFAHILQRYMPGPLGSPTFRWVVFVSAAAVAALGWGALAGGRASAGDSRIDGWVVGPIVFAVLAMVLIAMLATRRMLGKRIQLGPMMLFLGVLFFGAGLLTVGLGQILVGSALAMAGGGLVYSGVTSAAGLAPAAPPPLVRPRVETGSRSRPTTGVKVRIPKGDAVRVSRFSDDDAPRGGSE